MPAQSVIQVYGPQARASLKEGRQSTALYNKLYSRCHGNLGFHIAAERETGIYNKCAQKGEKTDCTLCEARRKILEVHKTSANTGDHDGTAAESAWSAMAAILRTREKEFHSTKLQQGMKELLLASENGKASAGSDGGISLGDVKDASVAQKAQDKEKAKVKVANVEDGTEKSAKSYAHGFV